MDIREEKLHLLVLKRKLVFLFRVGQYGQFFGKANNFPRSHFGNVA